MAGEAPRAALALAAVLLLQLLGSLAPEGTAPLPAKPATQAPALAAVVPLAPQHAQALQPAVMTALLAQQQPPRHSPTPQSMLPLGQASPGYSTAQDPVACAQALQPRRAARGEQQKPPRHVPLAQLEGAAQGAPGG
jgi:hypothetical protein